MNDIIQSIQLTLTTSILALEHFSSDQNNAVIKHHIPEPDQPENNRVKAMLLRKQVTYSASRSRWHLERLQLEFPRQIRLVLIRHALDNSSGNVGPVNSHIEAWALGKPDKRNS